MSVQVKQLTRLKLRPPVLALEGLSAAGKDFLGVRLSEILGVPYIKFPLVDDPSRDRIAHAEACKRDMLEIMRAMNHTTAPGAKHLGFIAGNWSVACAAYSEPQMTVCEISLEIPKALSVFVETPRPVRQWRLEYGVARRRAIDDEQVQACVEYQYDKLIGADDWFPVVVSGIDFQSDLKAILEHMSREIRL